LTGDAKLAEQIDDRIYRAAAIADGAIHSLLCIAPAGLTPHWDALGPLELDDAGGPITPMSTMIESETIVCACFAIGDRAIRDACTAARSVSEIGQATRAGTNCGSCLPELRSILANERKKERMDESAHAG
jgi:assimilatory nitrate reductase catalytic subunit